MADKSIYISSDDTQNYPFCRFQLMVEKFGNLKQNEPFNSKFKVPMVDKPTNKKTILIDFGD